jgi:hypothetical protein
VVPVVVVVAAVAERDGPARVGLAELEEWVEPVVLEAVAVSELAAAAVSELAAVERPQAPDGPARSEPSPSCCPNWEVYRDKSLSRRERVVRSTG